MITKISRKRSSQEREAWKAVQDLMPRGRKTRGLQYEVLEYLFEHLYEKVSEQQLYDHLLEIKGCLQKTGDPVKGAINQAVKELQRLNDRSFELVKLQELGSSNKLHRYIQLNFNRYNAVIDFSEYQEYLEDLLEGESHLVVRLTVAHLRQGSVVWPGFARMVFTDHKVEAVLCLSARSLVSHRPWESRYVPDSPIGGNTLLVYENEDTPYPFLGFICDDDRTDQENSQFILYRGQEKLSKLKFLDRLWRASYQRALSLEQVEAIEARCREEFGEPLNEALVQGLVLEQCMEQDAVMEADH